MIQQNTSKALSRTLLAALIVCTVPSVALSQEQDPGFAKTGGYAGGSFVPKFTFDGDTFDGQTYYQEIGGPEIGILPKLDKQGMFKGILGYRGRKHAIEFSYERTQHHGTFYDATGEATFQQFNLDGRFFFLTSKPIQPYFLAGGGLPFLTVKDGSFLEDNLEAGFGDGKWKGYALNTEVGVTVYPHRRVGIVMGYAYHAIWFDRATGITGKLYELRPRFRETSKGVVVTTMFTF
jgi:hypothetical protein